MRTVVLETAVLEHRDDRTDGVFPNRPLLLHRALERCQLGDAAALAHAELDPAAADQIQGGDPLGDPGRMVRGQLDDTVAKADILGPLAGRAEEDFRGRTMGVFLQEMMLHHPGGIDAEAVGQFDLVERILE